jgi:predicted HTH transcriptional regulator
VHRDLVLRDQPTRVHVFDRSLEFLNPRRTNGFSPIAGRSIRYGVPQRLNPQLAAMFTNPGYGLQLPVGGLPMLLRESRAFSGRRAEILTNNDEFRLRLHAA